jgi:hypothetical protein
LEEGISPEEGVSPLIPKTLDVYNLGGLALEHYNKAKDYLLQGNWAEYGKELENLEKVLKDIARITREKK